MLRGSSGSRQLCVVFGCLFLLLRCLQFVQPCDPLRLVGAYSVTIVSPTSCACLLAFAQLYLAGRRPCATTAHLRLLGDPMYPNSFYVSLGGVVGDTLHNYCVEDRIGAVFLVPGSFYCLSIHPYQVCRFVLNKSKINFRRPKINFGMILLQYLHNLP